FQHARMQQKLGRRRLAAAVEASRPQRRCFLGKDLTGPIVLRAASGKHGAAAASVLEGMRELQRGSDPVEIVRSRPKRSGCRVPGEVNKMIGTNGADERRGNPGNEQIAGVKSSAPVKRRGRAADGVNLMAAGEQLRDHTPSDEPGGTG